jgi:succinate dehydrogenase / fumarate reductase cytochrome b subunit
VEQIPMSAKQRPLSPFMIGPYYRPQLTSVLSITHRATGVVLCVVTIPLLLAWLGAVAGGEESYAAAQACLDAWYMKALVLLSLFSLSFHLLNGVRHLFWDTGRGLELPTAYVSGWIVLAGAIAATVILAGVLS